MMELFVAKRRKNVTDHVPNPARTSKKTLTTKIVNCLKKIWALTLSKNANVFAWNPDQNPDLRVVVTGIPYPKSAKVPEQSRKMNTKWTIGSSMLTEILFGQIAKRKKHIFSVMNRDNKPRTFSVLNSITANLSSMAMKKKWKRITKRTKKPKNMAN